jgi:glycosyltransferase involved in cell wall biosynthesis
MTSPPDFSVIIPTLDRPQAVMRCLDALCKLDRNGPAFEVIVVDDGGLEALDRVIAPARDRLQVTLLCQSNAGPGAARNAGARAARGRWLAFTDDDCEPDSQWLSGFARRFAVHPESVLGGQTVNLLDDNLYCTAHQLLVDYVTRDSHSGGTEPRFFASNNMAMPAELLRALGGFDATFRFAAGEDRDLCARVRAAGHRLSEVPEALVRHHHPMEFSRFCRVHHRYGRGACRFRRKAAVRQGGRVHLEPAAFYVGLLLTPLSSSPMTQAPSLCMALLISQICHAVGYARERWSE